VIALGDAMGVNLRVTSVVTPTQAGKLIVDTAVINAYSAKQSGAARLAPLDTKKLKRMFNQE
jgi:hypothetical protein